MSGRLRLAVDIGGTFTDGVLLEDGTDRTWTTQGADHARRPERGLHRGDSTSCCGRRVLPAVATSCRSTHATTLTTNTLLQRRGARTALLVTAGFEDMLEIGRQIRHELYDLQTNKPEPLVPRSWVLPGHRAASTTGATS